jgi:glutamate/tyrosine decarboxylase-like PLP-dependent enzyme
MIKTIKLDENVHCVQSIDIDITKDPKDILNSFDAEALIKNHKCCNETVSYERIVLYKSEDTEIVFCHWKETNESIPHFHPDVECWYKCLKGELTESRCRDELVYKINTGEISHINDSHGSHQISNKSKSCTFTLHLYKKTQALKYEDAFSYTLNKAKTLSTAKVSNPLAPEVLKEKVDISLSEGPTEQKLTTIIDGIFDNSVNTQNPRFLNQLFGGSTEESWLGELITAILNTSMATYEIAPLATLMEKEILARINDEIQFDEFEGLIVPGGSYANMLGLNCARFLADSSSKKTGMYEIQKQIFYVSEDAHYSSSKSLALMGLGTDCLVKIKVDSQRKMCLEDLRKQIKTSKDNGDRPTCIVSTAGTTVYGAFDPIAKVNKLCKEEGIWHHVDAAWGGLALWSDRKEVLFNSVKDADSITLDFHKLMASTLTKGIFITSKPEILKGANAGGGSKYIFHDDRGLDIGNYAIQCGRKVDSLPIWLQWKLQGTKHYRNKVTELYALQKWFVEKLKASPTKYKIILDPEFMNICFQVKPSDSSIDISEFNKKAREVIMENGHFMVNFSSNTESGYFFRLVFNHWGVSQDILNELLLELDQQL